MNHKDYFVQIFFYTNTRHFFYEKLITQISNINLQFIRKFIPYRGGKIR